MFGEAITKEGLIAKHDMVIRFSSFQLLNYVFPTAMARRQSLVKYRFIA